MGPMFASSAFANRNTFRATYRATMRTSAECASEPAARRVRGSRACSRVGIPAVQRLGRVHLDASRDR